MTTTAVSNEAVALPTQAEIDNALAYVSLYHFVQQLWHTVEKKPFKDGWHIEMICDHLEAVSNGDITRLLINIPPRHSKSLIVSVFWPMWDWLKKPERQWMFSSYAQSLSIRDSRKARLVFNSDRYQELLSIYNPDLVMVGDQNTKIRFENSEGGQRLATSVGGALTGEGGDIIVFDDAHNVQETESETVRSACLDWWDEAMSTRLNDEDSGAFVGIGQRVHEEDIFGHIMEREGGDWDQVILPARYEGNRVKSSLGVEDPRTKPDELLCPNRFSEDALRRLERSLGSYATASQLQQRPSPRGGGMMQVANFGLMEAFNPNFIVKSIRYWDKAGTEGGGARTASVLMHLMRNGSFIISDVVKGQWSYAERERRIEQVAALDAARYGKTKVTIWTEQEPGSGGKESADRTIKMLSGYPAFKESPTGDKVVRAQPFSAQVEIENVFLVKGPPDCPSVWVEEYIGELELFPRGKFKDQTDASSGAFNKLTNLGADAEKTAGVFGRKKRDNGVNNNKRIKRVRRW